MFRHRYNICFLAILVSLISIQAFAQQFNISDSVGMYKYQKLNLKPKLSYSMGSTFLSVPHLGTVAGFTISPFLSIPLSQRLSVGGGIIAGHYYSTLPNFNNEGAINGVFNELYLFGAASYHFNPQLTLYGIGTKQLTNNSPFSSLPKSSYTFGSAYNFGSFSIGLSLQMSKWNNTLSPFNSSPGFYSPFEQRIGTFY